MNFLLLTAPLRDAWRTATNQEAQLAVVTAAFPGNVELRYFSASDVLLDTVTHAGWDMSATNPRFLSPRGISGRLFGASAAAAYVIAAVPGGADILRADVALSGNVAASRRTNLGAGSGADGLQIVANSALPANSMPSWYPSTLNQWVEIPGTLATSLQSARAIDGYNGWAVIPETSELIFAAIGGHEDGNVNSVISIRLTDAVPAWVQRTPPSADADRLWNGAYNADGKPASRHIYHSVFWVPSLNRIILPGARFTSGVAGPPQYGTVDGWNPTTNTWDPGATTITPPVGVQAGPPPQEAGLYNNDGTYPNIVTGLYGQVQDNDGNIWSNGNRKFDVTTLTWSAPALSGGANIGRFPVACHPPTNRLFSLQWGDGQGFDSGVNATVVNATTLATSAITWSAGSAAAVAAFTSAAPAYATMDWDADNGRFLFWAGSGNIYVITPNSGTVWDMSILSVTGSTPTVGAGGLNKRFSYIPALKGFVAQPTGASNLRFLRVA